MNKIIKKILYFLLVFWIFFTVSNTLTYAKDVSLSTNNLEKSPKELNSEEFEKQSEKLKKFLDEMDKGFELEEFEKQSEKLTKILDEMDKERIKYFLSLSDDLEYKKEVLKDEIKFLKEEILWIKEPKRFEVIELKSIKEQIQILKKEIAKKNIEIKIDKIKKEIFYLKNKDIFGPPFEGNYPVTARFGSRENRDSITNSYKSHKGVSFGVPMGTKILSIGDGVVTDTGDVSKVCEGISYGKWILIKYNNGVSLLYAHLSEISVLKGQHVKKGQYIGKSGDTGYTFGPILYIAMYYTKFVYVKKHKYTYWGRCYGKKIVDPVSPWEGYLNPLKNINYQYKRM